MLLSEAQFSQQHFNYQNSSKLCLLILIIAYFNCAADGGAPTGTNAQFFAPVLPNCAVWSAHSHRLLDVQVYIAYTHVCGTIVG